MTKFKLILADLADQVGYGVPRPSQKLVNCSYYRGTESAEKAHPSKLTEAGAV